MMVSGLTSSTLFVVCLLMCCYSSWGANKLFDLQVRDLEGNTVSLSQYSKAKAILVGKVLMLLFLISSVNLIVNVASNCGFTYTNYIELAELYQKLHPKGLEILAFPCNQFGEQEPGTPDEIKMFTQNLGINFPMFSKVNNLQFDVFLLFTFYCCFCTFFS
jgi:glutathione peroxidase